MDFWQPISKKYGDSLGQEPLGLSPIVSYQQKLRGGHVLRGTMTMTTPLGLVDNDMAQTNMYLWHVCGYVI
jgi:hypothetical protein